MKKRIQEVVTFIKATRDEAITLANDIAEDAEVHALVVQSGLTMASTPVGYMVVPRKEWVGLTPEEVDSVAPYCHNKFDLAEFKDFASAIETKLKKKNT
jgi:hypothetical protein